jgi:hypothetical protein
MERYSADLQREWGIETSDTRISVILRFVDNGVINVILGPGAVLADNGETLLVKEALSDTLFYYADDALTPAYILDPGNYAIHEGALGINPSVETGDSYAVIGVLESDRYVFAETYGYKNDVRMHLIFDRTDEAGGGFSPLGPDGAKGLFLDGIRVSPMYVRDNRLVGVMQALDIVDAADRLTQPETKELAAGLHEESNPVIVVVELK